MCRGVIPQRLMLPNPLFDCCFRQTVMNPFLGLRGTALAFCGAWTIQAGIPSATACRARAGNRISRPREKPGMMAETALSHENIARTPNPARGPASASISNSRLRGFRGRTANHCLCFYTIRDKLAEKQIMPRPHPCVERANNTPHRPAI